MAEEHYYHSPGAQMLVGHRDLEPWRWARRWASAKARVRSFPFGRGGFVVGLGRKPAELTSVAGHAVGELAEDIEVAGVSGGLIDQANDDEPERHSLAGVAIHAYRFLV